MIENTLLHFKTKTAFNIELEAGNIKDDSITFVQDSKEIITHGESYKGVSWHSAGTVSDGVYAVSSTGELIDYNTADETCIAVTLVVGEHKFWIAKNDATNGTNNTLYWGNNLYDKNVAGITETTDQSVAKADFNGKANTDAIIAAYGQHSVDMDSRDMCKVLETYTEGGFTDWYVPAAGQLYEMYNKKSDINAALQNIGGTALKSNFYWSSSEYDSGLAWIVNFDNGNVNYNNKYGSRLVRFVRDIEIKEPVNPTFIHCPEKSQFTTQLESGNIPNETIVFIDDTKEIWTHGTYYDCSEDDLAAVAKSGSYNDLNDKPNIPNEVTEQTVVDWGFTKNQGTITEVKMNGASKGTSGVVDLGNVITEHQDISSKQDKISDLETIRSGASLGVTAVQPSQLSTVATSGSYDDLINKPTLPSSTSPLPIDSGGTGSNNAEDACDNIGAIKKYDISKTLSKEGWYRIGLLKAIMSTSSARIIVGGTNADVSPIIMDFQHNFRGNTLSQMPTVMTPLYVTKVRAARYTSDDVYIDLYFTNIASSHTTARVIPYEGTFEPINFVDVTDESVAVLTSIDVVKDGFLNGRATTSEVDTKLTGKVDTNGTVTSVIAMTQSEYDALTTKDSTTLYIITE